MSTAKKNTARKSPTKRGRGRPHGSISEKHRTLRDIINSIASPEERYKEVWKRALGYSYTTMTRKRVNGKIKSVRKTIIIPGNDKLLLWISEMCDGRAREMSEQSPTKPSLSDLLNFQRSQMLPLTIQNPSGSVH